MVLRNDILGRFNQWLLTYFTLVLSRFNVKEQEYEGDLIFSTFPTYSYSQKSFSECKEGQSFDTSFNSAYKVFLKKRIRVSRLLIRKLESQGTGTF